MKCACLCLMLLLPVSCAEEYHISGTGRIVAYVHWGDQPLAGREVELLQTSERKTTDTSGTVAFELVPGTYTVRAYAINRPGPTLGYLDFEVTVKAGRTDTLDVVDCLPCV